MTKIKFFRIATFLVLAFASTSIALPFNLIGQTPKKTETKAKSNIKNVKLEVSGMTCQKGCADGIDKKLRKTSGIIKSNTLHKSGVSEVTYDASVISVKQIIGIIEGRGYEAKLVTAKS